MISRFFVYCVRINGRDMQTKSSNQDRNKIIQGGTLDLEKIEVSEEVKSWRMPRQFTEEEIASDDRLAYILSK